MQFQQIATLFENNILNYTYVIQNILHDKLNNRVIGPSEI